MSTKRPTLTVGQLFVISNLLVLPYIASAVAVPVVVALLIAMLLSPAVELLQTIVGKRWFAVIILVFAIGSVSYLTMRMLVSSLYELTLQIPKGVKQGRLMLSELGMWAGGFDFAEITPSVSFSEGVTRVEVVDRIPFWMQFLLKGIRSASDLALMMLFIPLISIYLLIEKPKLVESSSAILGEHFDLPKLYGELPKILRAFVFGNFLVGLLVGFMHCLVLYCVGVSSWPALGIMTGFVSMIPLVGTPFSLAITLLSLMGEANSLVLLTTVGVSFFAIDVLGSNMLLPLLIGARLNLNSACIATGLLFWGWYWGAVGFVLAIPMTAALKIFFEANQRTVRFANLMAAKPKFILGNPRRKTAGDP